MHYHTIAEARSMPGTRLILTAGVPGPWGEAAKAIAEYTKVEDRFADAKQAIEYFARKDISLPEVSTIKPGDKAVVIVHPLKDGGPGGSLVQITINGAKVGN